MRYFTVGKYQVSIVLLIVVLIAMATSLGGAYYLWATRTIPLSVEEPLSVTQFPTSLSVHPGENRTLNITILNSAAVNYSVILTFTLNETLFQESYVTFSNHTYSIAPGINHITGWIAISKKAHAATLSLSIDFFRE